MARRIVNDQAERYVRNQFKLAGWVGKNAARQERYFAACDKARAMVREITGPDEPPDDAVVDAIVGAVKVDDTFSDHVAKREGASFLADSDKWDQITHTAAGTIYHEYLVACEKDEWTEGQAESTAEADS